MNMNRTLYCENQLKQDIKFIVLNPKMDIICVVTTSNQIIMFRFPSFEQINIIKRSELGGGECNCCIWSFDGIRLCIGNDKGKISIYNIETCKFEPVLFNNNHSSKITSMLWKESDIKIQNIDELMLSTDIPELNINTPTKSISYLIIGDENGNLSFVLNGVYLLINLQLKSQISNIILSPNKLYINTEKNLFCYDLEFLQNNNYILYIISCRLPSITKIVNYMKDTINSMKNQWEIGINSSDYSVKECLWKLYCTGIIDDSISQFFNTKFSAIEGKNLYNDINNLIDKIIKSFQYDIYKNLENILLIISSIKSYTESNNNNNLYNNNDNNKNTLTQFIILINDFGKIVYDSIDYIFKCKEYFKILFGWIIKQAKQISNDKTSDDIAIPQLDTSLVENILHSNSEGEKLMSYKSFFYCNIDEYFISFKEMIKQIDNQIEMINFEPLKKCNTMMFESLNINPLCSNLYSVNDINNDYLYLLYDNDENCLLLLCINYHSNQVIKYTSIQLKEYSIIVDYNINIGRREVYIMYAQSNGTNLSINRIDNMKWIEINQLLRDLDFSSLNIELNQVEINYEISEFEHIIGERDYLALSSSKNIQIYK